MNIFKIIGLSTIFYSMFLFIALLLLAIPVTFTLYMGGLVLTILLNIILRIWRVQ